MLKAADAVLPGPRLPEGVRRRLAAVTVALAVLTLLHDLDHVRQGRALRPHLYAVGLLALVSILATLAVVLRRHPRAATLAVTQGVVTVTGVAVVHAAPHWSSLADSYSAAHVDALSWAVIGAMMLAGLVLAVVGAPAARAEWWPRSRASRGPPL